MGFVGKVYFCAFVLLNTNWLVSAIVEHRSHSPSKNEIGLRFQYQTYYFEQQVDHFNYANQDAFKQRYLVADQFWDKHSGPIFFYTGNEGDIAWFCNNTGLMWDWAPEFKALLVFAEHRYYGESLPYGKESYKDLSRLGYLTAEQALADFTTLIDHIKATIPGTADKPVIAFGGSYGGMLAAWFRMKYPNIVLGSLAASAPIWQFGDLVPCSAFFQQVTKDFRRESDMCVENIKKSWSTITSLGNTEAGRKFLQEAFTLCKPLASADDVGLLKYWLSSAYSNLGMVDYPYPANFLEPLPAWPIREVCQPLAASSLSGHELVTSLSKAVQVYYNYTGDSDCLSINNQATEDLGDKGWDFQACTEMVMPMCSDGKQDMFEPSPWNFEEYATDCKKKWGTTPRPSWILQQFGGKDIKSASNIIFSNGELDPWMPGGVRESLSSSLIAITVPDGAHHLDLRGATPNDPPSLVNVRIKEKQIIQQWLKDHKESYDKSIVNPYGYMGRIFGGDDDTSMQSVASLGDTSIIVGTFIFALGATVLLFYLGLAQKIQRHLVRRRIKSTEIITTPTHLTENLLSRTLDMAGRLPEKTPI